MMRMKPILPVAIIAIAFAAAALFFDSSHVYPLLTDIRLILTPMHRPDLQERSHTIDSYIVAYKKDLHRMKEREDAYTDSFGEKPMTESAEPDTDIIMNLKVAELHIKYANMVSERGYNWAEVERLMSKADQGDGRDTFCENLGPERLQHTK